MSTSNTVIVIVFGVWAAVSVAVQIRLPPLTKLRKIDHLQVLPVWKLFAPRPIIVDYRVSYRTWDVDGFENTAWSPLHVTRDRRELDTVFNTQRRARKALRFSARYLTRHSLDHARAHLVTTPSYLLVLGASKREVIGNAKAHTIQFRVERVRSYYLRPVTVSRYVSERHSM